MSRPSTETGHARVLATVFGQVNVTRIAYRKPGRGNLHPADATLNLPAERHSHGLRRLAAVESSRGPSTTRARRWTGPPGNRWANVRSRSSPPEPRSTSTASTPPGNRHRPLIPATCWCCPATARGWSCAPTRYARRPRRQRSRPPRSWRAGCPRARSATASGWPRWARSTTPAPPRAPRPTSCRPTRTNAHAPHPARPPATSG